MHDNPTSLRSKIALAGWTTSVIAICSAVLRTCILVQLWTCSLMMAALAFEWKFVLFRDAAAMSIYRYCAADPYSLVFPMVRGTTVGKKPQGVLLILLLSILTILSQFTSTILFSDTNVGFIIGPVENVSVPYAVKRTFTSPEGASYLNSQPQEFPRFAEKTANMVSITDNFTQHHIDDTGATVRAVLPLPSANRTSLFNYKGVATLIDSHALCVTPVIKDYTYNSSTLQLAGNFTAPLFYTAYNSGELGAQGSFKGGSFDANTTISFTCNNMNMYSGTTLCRALANYPANSFEESEIPVRYADSSLNVWWFVMRLDKRTTGLGQIPTELGPVGTYTHNGTEWISQTVQGSLYTTQTDITLCLTTFQLRYANVSVGADAQAKEPQYKIMTDIEAGPEQFNTTAIRRQLGIETQTHQERHFDAAQLQLHEQD